MNLQLCRFIIRIVIFFVLLLPAYLVFSYAWSKLPLPVLRGSMKYVDGQLSYTYLRLKEAERTKNVDVLFLGSSRTYRGFDTRVFRKAGYNAFNLGTTAQKPLQTEMLLDRFIDNLNPKVVIFEVCPLIFNDEGLESSVDLIQNSKLNNEILGFVWRSKNIILLNCLIAKTGDKLLNLNIKLPDDSSTRTESYVSGGFVENKAKTMPSKLIPIAVDWKENKNQFLAFDRIVKKLKARHIQLILVQAPTMPTFYQAYPNNAMFDQKMQKYAPYFNFNEVMSLGISSFYDENHLTYDGVKIFNEKLIDVVLKPLKLTPNVSI